MIYYIMDTDDNRLIEACANEQEAHNNLEDYQKDGKNVKLIIGGWN